MASFVEDPEVGVVDENAVAALAGEFAGDASVDGRFSWQVFFPNVAILPIRRKTHVRGDVPRMVAQELNQAIRPVLARLNNIEEVGKHYECVVNRAGVGMELCEQRGGLFARQGESHGEAAVPESRVMRADIASNGQVMQEGAEDFFVEPVSIRDGLSVGRGG